MKRKYYKYCSKHEGGMAEVQCSVGPSRATVRGVDLFDPGQSEHHLASVAGVFGMRVIAAAPQRISLQVDCF